MTQVALCLVLEACHLGNLSSIYRMTGTSKIHAGESELTIYQVDDELLPSKLLYHH